MVLGHAVGRIGLVERLLALRVELWLRDKAVQRDKFEILQSFLLVICPAHEVVRDDLGQGDVTFSVAITDAAIFKLMQRKWCNYRFFFHSFIFIQF